MKKVIITLIIIIVLSVIYVFSVNAYVKLSTKDKILTIKEATKLEDIDCILVLGAGIWGDKPSPMLEDRLLTGIELYNKKISNKIVMSGDHGQEEYDEVNIMKQYAIDNGIESSDIFMDHAGFSTYESIYRIKEIFNAKKVVIVTQKYHLHRALYIAEQLGIEAYGVNSDPRQYQGQLFREIREILARNKDFINCIIKPEPTYLGETIPVSGDGNITNDKPSKEDEEEKESTN